MVDQTGDNFNLDFTKQVESRVYNVIRDTMAKGYVFTTELC